MTRLVNESEALRTVMALLRMEGVTGHEGVVARFIVSELRKAGVPARNIRTDRFHSLICF